jgi:hypothetical protein
MDWDKDIILPCQNRNRPEYVCEIGDHPQERFRSRCPILGRCDLATDPGEGDQDCKLPDCTDQWFGRPQEGAVCMDEGLQVYCGNGQIKADWTCPSGMCDPAKKPPQDTPITCEEFERCGWSKAPWEL